MYSGCDTPDAGASSNKYVRFLIRGKRGRGVPIMLNTLMVQHLKLILDLRNDANVFQKNPYLFGVPGPECAEHLQADRLMNKYDVACGAEQPKTLRGPELRKHFATLCGTMSSGMYKYTIYLTIWVIMKRFRWIITNSLMQPEIACAYQLS